MEPNRFNSRIKLTPQILNKIAKIDEFKGLWKGSLKLSPQLLGRLKASVIITSTGASTRIEGSQMSDEEVARLLRGLKTNPPKNRDEQEVAGYADLLGRIFDTFRTTNLTESVILQFHSILLQFSDKDRAHRGAYKNADNTVIMDHEGKQVVLFHPTPPYLVRPEMEAILAWTNQELEKKELHPLLVIANFIFEFLAIHPFIDGNGRLSRALTNLLLLRSDYGYVPYVSMDDLIENRKEDYYLALRATQKHHKTDQEDITAWLDFFVGILLEQAENARALMNSEQPEKLLSEKQEQVYALFTPGELLSISDLNKKLGGAVTYATLKQALARLVTLRLLEKMGQGRGTRYKKIS